MNNSTALRQAKTRNTFFQIQIEAERERRRRRLRASELTEPEIRKLKAEMRVLAQALLADLLEKSCTREEAVRQLIQAGVNREDLEPMSSA